MLKSKNYCTVVFDKKYDPKKDENDASLLHIVASKGYCALFKILLEEIQDTNPKMNDGSTILHCAAEKGQFAICKLIIERVQINNPPAGLPSEALIINSIQIMDTLEAADCFGNTPLHKAAINGHLSVVELVCLEKVHNRKRPQWKKFTRKKFTVLRKTALKILVKRSQYI